MAAEYKDLSIVLDITGYTIGDNFPLNHARILWDMVEGTIVADGTNADFAANDYTAQRWALEAGENNWTLTLPQNTDIDTVMISAHNLSGCDVTIRTSPDLVTAFTDRSTLSLVDNSTIAALFNDGAGDPISVRRLQINVDEGLDKLVGIIRAGTALQMQRPFYQGYSPIKLNRVTEGQQEFSETANWLGRTEKRVGVKTTYSWAHLSAAWYRANFEPFARTIPLSPFGIIGNPTKMPEDIAWASTSMDAAPVNTGPRDLMSVELNVIGLWE
jgi:hypothetical protein